VVCLPRPQRGQQCISRTEASVSSRSSYGADARHKGASIKKRLLNLQESLSRRLGKIERGRPCFDIHDVREVRRAMIRPVSTRYMHA
jgi:hypothetical protein